MNDLNGKEIGLLDILTIISFILNLQNYGENIDQSKLQDTMGTVLKDIHSHLNEQDEKIDEIIKALKGEDNGIH